MNNDNNLNATNNQFVISYELLSLLQWIVDHDTPKLKKMISCALREGLRQEIERSASSYQERQAAENAQYTIIDFFGVIEALMAETIHEQTQQTVVEKNLMPALDRIDASVCDEATIKLSVEKATAQMDQKPYADPQDMLFKELLKRWKPNKKNIH